MGLAIATTGGGICFAFPDVCKTPPGPVPVPYPNIGRLEEASGVPISLKNVRVAGHWVITKDCKILETRGDEAGSGGGIVIEGKPGGPVIFTSASETVKVNGQGVVRMTDTTTQNDGNANGMVLGGVSNVLCG